MKGKEFRPSNVDLAAIRARLDGIQGQHYWRSLEEVIASNEFRGLLQKEFALGASEWGDDLSRRSFLKMAAASLALSGLTACTKQPMQTIRPYVDQPQEMVLGQPLFYATAMLQGGFATGVLVKSREGHPIKVDGNPDHPASRGASSVWLQASILELYDPDRSQGVTHHGELSTWAAFLADMNQVIQEQKVTQGAGLRFLTETVTSPTLAGQLDELLNRFPKAKWHQFDPVSRDHIRLGADLAFGEIVETHYDFDQAAVILSLDSDFLYTHPERLRYARDFSRGRRLRIDRQEMSRLYAAESTPSLTGTMADHRLPVGSGEIEGMARAIARAAGAETEAPRFSEEVSTWLTAAINDLHAHRGSSVVVAGEWQPAAVQALVHWINHQLGNVGRTVFYAASAEAKPTHQLDSFHELVQDMEKGSVQTLFMLGANPAYTAPSDLEFRRHIARVKLNVHLGGEWDETAALSAWHIPQAHDLESWSDARSFDGTITILQPLIAPLYGGKTVHEVLGALSQVDPERDAFDLVREYWRKQNLWPDFELGWAKALHDGFIQNSALPRKTVALRQEALGKILTPSLPLSPGQMSRPPREAPQNKARDLANTGWLEGETLRASRSPLLPLPQVDQNLELNFRPDPNVWDGRFANSGWLQECPRPITKLTWDNAVAISPALAQRFGLMTDDVVELTFHGRTLQAPVWVLPGQAPNSVTVHLGYGRTQVGRVGAGVGFNAYLLRTNPFFWFGDGLQLAKTDRRHHLVATQTHHNLHSPDRQIYREGTLQQFQKEADFVQRTSEAPSREQTLYQPGEYPESGYQWGMTIDLNTCIGCNACLLACGAENNIPVVGKDQVNLNREMSWIRIDTYYRGPLDNPQFRHMPVPCMHCEHAPCELVCPVEATVHDHEGLNLQVYNRCVGTRFCSNNCPYKVRRFNFLRYTDYQTPNFKPIYNPEVTVRWRGVMEKCTYCVQRISAARIGAEKENRRIRDGELRTACQQACPTEAIVFGDINQPDSQLAQLKQHPLNYSMLGELNTRPRTTYLAKLHNPNPSLAQTIRPGESL